MDSASGHIMIRQLWKKNLKSYNFWKSITVWASHRIYCIRECYITRVERINKDGYIDLEIPGYICLKHCRTVFFYYVSTIYHKMWKHNNSRGFFNQASNSFLASSQLIKYQNVYRWDVYSLDSNEITDSICISFFLDFKFYKTKK